jgi:DNA-3-methyladenine glycosylase II
MRPLAVAPVTGFAGRIMRQIETLDDVAEGTDWLCRIEPRFATVRAATGPWPLRRQPDGFAALLDAILGQQVSTASARAIAGRLQAADLWQPERIAASDEDALRASGLSRPKARYALALARARLDWVALRDLPDDAVIDTLVALPGIGRWTAEIYAMFALGRPDVLAAGDLALQEAARALLDLPARPDDRTLRALAQAWSPWRAVAARGLWAYYRILKSRDGVR